MHPYRLEDLFILKRVLIMPPWLSVNSGCCCLSLPGASGSIHLILQCMYCFRMQTSGKCSVQEEHPCFPGNGPKAMPGCSLFSNAKHFIVKSEGCRASTKHVKHMLESSADVLCGCEQLCVLCKSFPHQNCRSALPLGFPGKLSAFSISTVC